MTLGLVGEQVYIWDKQRPSSSPRVGSLPLNAITIGLPCFFLYLKATFSSLFKARSTSSAGPAERGSALENRDPCQSSK